MAEAGFGKWHSCDFGNIMNRDLTKTFLPKNCEWVEDGKKGYEVEITISIYGVVEQKPPCHWIHVVSKNFKLKIPSIFHDILGEELVVDGHFAFIGEKPSRMKKTKIIFIEREKGTLKANIPTDTKIKINWKDAFIPEPLDGMWWWGAYVEVISWEAWD